MSDFSVQRLLVLSIVDELRRTFRYLHPCDQNSNSYSIALYSTILQAASASERLIKLRCSELGIVYKVKLPEDRRVIADGLKLSGSSVMFHDWSGGRVFSPFLTWGSQGSTPWWDKYNAVKHDSANALQSSTLENAMYSVSAAILALGPHLISDGMTWLTSDLPSGTPASRFSDLGFSVVASEDFWNSRGSTE